jgi:hypothetical protein
MKPFIPREWMRMRKQPHPTAILDHVDQFGTAVFTDGKCVYAPYSPGEVCWVRERWRRASEKVPDGIYYPDDNLLIWFTKDETAPAREAIKKYPRDGKIRSAVAMPEIFARRYVRILSCVPEQRGEWGWRVEWEEVRK